MKAQSAKRKNTDGLQNGYSGSRQTIFRSAARHKPYAQLRNTMLRDARIGFAARGLLAFMLSYPITWKLRQVWICKKQKISRDRFYRLINELIEAGHCARRRGRRPNGTLGPYEYVFSDEPETITEIL